MQKSVGSSPGLRMLVRAICAYALSAFLFLLLASFLLSRSDVGSHVLGYVSSVISFLSAFISTRQLMRSQKSHSLFAALLFGVLLVILLMTLGFLAGERALDPSGVLSVVSFTFTGVLLGGLLPLHLPRRSSHRRRDFLRYTGTS